MKKKQKLRTPANARELAVMRKLVDGSATISELAKRFRRAGTPEAAASWVRNALRRPLRLGWIKQVARGTYNSTPIGRRDFRMGAR